MNRKIKIGIAGALFTLGALTTVDGCGKLMKAESQYKEQTKVYTSDDDAQRIEYLLEKLPTLTSGPSRYDGSNKERNSLYSEWDSLLDRGALGKRDEYIQAGREYTEQVNWNMVKTFLPSFVAVAYLSIIGVRREIKKRE